LTYLLDVNVLIALIDPKHIHNALTQDWFDQEGRGDWATCPITENGVVRIVGNQKYPNSPGSPAVVLPVVTALRALPGHCFWTDDFSLAESGPIDPGKILTSGQVTDSYLLALAAKHGGKLATLDRRLSVNAVRGGKSALHIIGQV
jgi:toxin-antitoxin system PIN domain toxin